MVVHLLAVASASLAAAACYSVSDVVEQRKAAAAPPETSLRIALLWHLAKQPIWWLAIAVDIGGFGMQAVALGIGQIVFVQPLLLMSLPMSLVLGHRVGSHVLSRGDVGWAVVFVAALSAFLIIGDPTGDVSQRSLSVWLLPLVIVACLTIVVMTVSHRIGAVARSLALGLAAGMLFGVSSTLMKSFAHLIAQDGWRMLAHWEPYVMAVAVSLGFLVMQSAFQAGDLRTSLPTVNLSEPVVAGLLGILVLQERFQAKGPIETALLVVSVIVMVLGTVRLARSAAADDPEANLGGTDQPTG